MASAWGYAEVGRQGAEFNITGLAGRRRENTLAVEVYRLCDGSYMEDQDFGVYRPDPAGLPLVGAAEPTCAISSCALRR
jgi:hypothetical protein